jgi:hypothetical protein
MVQTDTLVNRRRWVKIQVTSIDTPVVAMLHTSVASGIPPREL